MAAAYAQMDQLQTTDSFGPGISAGLPTLPAENSETTEDEWNMWSKIP